MLLLSCLTVCFSAAAHSWPPDKGAPHIIKTRSIEINNAHALTLEAHLEKVVEPTGYRLELEPYLEDGVFRGHVSINITWLRDSDFIQIHCAHQLQISSWGIRLDVVVSEPVKVNVKDISMDLKKPITTLYLDKSVRAGSKGHMDLYFNGNLATNSSEAFFKTLNGEQEVDRIAVATHLLPNDASRMFPCFDDPEYKTPFDISVVRPRHMVALSNMPIARTDSINGESEAVRDHFERTPPMSTHTLGLVIAEMELLPNSTHFKDDIGNDLELRVWGRAEILDSLQGLNHKLSTVFHELAHYFNTPLPLRKLDIVALPNYMEEDSTNSWGLVVYRESDLSNLTYIYNLVYELAYQWLGALTTPERWSDAQVNKALVGYISMATSVKLEQDPFEYSNWPTTEVYMLYYGLSNPYLHDMKQMTLVKTELLFRMFNFTIGEATFKAGLKKFLKSRKFKTFNADDLWQALSQKAEADGQVADDVNLKQVALNWIEENRLPLVTVTRNYGKKEAIVTQSLYLRERPHDILDANQTTTWWVPLVIVRQDNLDFRNTTPTVWMKNEKEVVLTHMPSEHQFIIVNPEEIAPFPVNYDRENWRLLTAFLKGSNRDAIPPITRAKLLHDSWNLAYAGELSFVAAFEMTQMLKAEKDPLVWHPFFIMIDHLGRQIGQCLREKLNMFVRVMLIPLYEDVEEDQLKSRSYLRSEAKSCLCNAGYKPCVHEAQEQYRKWITLKNPDEGNPIADWFFCVVFMYGTMEEWEFALQRVIHFPSSRQCSERRDLLKTVAGCPTDEKKIMRVLKLAMLEGNGYFTETDVSLILSMMSGSAPGYMTLFKFLEENWDILREKYQKKPEIWDSLISCATFQFITRDDLDRVEGLYNQHKDQFGSATYIIENNMKKIKEEADWSELNLPIIEQEINKVLSANNMVDQDVYKTKELLDFDKQPTFGFKTELTISINIIWTKVRYLFV